MYSLRLLAWNDTNSRPAKLVRLLGRQYYTHVALQVGSAVAHVGIGKPAKWTSRSAIERTMGTPSLDLSLGVAEVNVTELNGMLAEACPRTPTILSGIWNWLTFREVPGSCVKMTRHLLAQMGTNVPDHITKPDALVRYLNVLFDSSSCRLRRSADG